jgi:acetyltransferase-like isoleucine patch superfamily enzyme
MRKLSIRKSENNQNSLRLWKKMRNPLRVYFNFIVLQFCRYSPSLRLKNLLYRMLGMKVDMHVSIGLGAMFDIFYPELIEIGENSIIGYNCTMLAHEFLVEEVRTGPVKIGRNVLIGANCTLLPGIFIGDGAKVSAMSLVNRNIPPRELWGGIPIKRIKKL